MTTTLRNVPGVQVVLAGPVGATMPVRVTMDCQPISTALACSWPSAANVAVGTYSLEVSAAGYETETTQVKVVYGPAENQCSCAAYGIDPHTVSPVPTDGGTD